MAVDGLRIIEAYSADCNSAPSRAALRTGRYAVAVPPLIYPVAGGVYLLPAAAVLALMILARAAGRWRGMRVAALGAGVLAAAVIVASAPAVDGVFAAAWVASMVAWVAVGPGRRPRIVAWRSLASAAALACTVIGGAVEVGRERLVPLPPGRASTLCVVGDSVTAGLGRPGEVPWPARLRSAHGVGVVDLSRAGCTVGQAVGRAAPVARDSGVVLLGIGGTDLIGRTDPGRFAADLDALARVVSGPGRQIVMFELPRFPLDDAYGRQQRRVAKRHGIRLVPRRRFADVLAGPGATVDGIHLSNVGQQRFAELVWRVVGPAMSGVMLPQVAAGAATPVRRQRTTFSKSDKSLHFSHL